MFSHISHQPSFKLILASFSLFFWVSAFFFSLLRIYLKINVNTNLKKNPIIYLYSWLQLPLWFLNDSLPLRCYCLTNFWWLWVDVLILVLFPQYVPPDLCVCNFVLEQSLSVRALQEMLASTVDNGGEGVSTQGVWDLSSPRSPCFV